MKIKFWGTRGSIPTPGKDTIAYGGNTPCVQVFNDNGEFIIIDAGTGIRELGKELIKRDGTKKLNLLISHTHWDHIQGLPFFSPLYYSGYEINIYSFLHKGIEGFEIFEAQWHPLFFPVDADVLNAKIVYHQIKDNQEYLIGGFNITTMQMNHSKGTLGFRINGEKKITYMTDNEIYFDINKPITKQDILEKNEKLIEFCKGSDYLIHDAMYNVKDNIEKVGWGHSNNISILHFAELAEVKNLVMFHYEPEYTDSYIDQLYDESKTVLDHLNYKINCIASKEGQEILL